MIQFQVSILYWVPLLHLLLKHTATSSSSSLAPSPSSNCEAVDNNNDDAGASWEQIEAKVDQAVAGVTKEVNKLSRRLEALASAVNQLNQNSNAAIGNRLKAEVGHLEGVMSCLHQCFHDDESHEQQLIEKRRKLPDKQRIVELEQEHACLHTCHHMYPH